MILEAPQLSVPMRKMTPSDWMDKVCPNLMNYCGAVYTADGSPVYSPSFPAQKFTVIPASDFDIQFPENALDVIFLTNIMELYDRSERREIKNQCLRALRKGGRLISCSLTCDDRKELIDHVLKVDGNVPPDLFKLRLTNKDIVELRPAVADYISYVDRYTHETFLKFLLSIGSCRTLENLWGVPKRFSTNRLSIGLVWIKG